MLLRELEGDELEHLWAMDRREVIDNVYYLGDGALLLWPEHCDVRR